MNLRDLQYLIALAETHHFGKASQRCFVSQPTLSGQIKKLEQELGITIFERNNRSVEITTAGEGILSHARIILEQADAIRQLALSYKDPTAGALRIGAIPTISPYLMPLILKPLQAKYAQMKLIISEEQTDTLLQRLKNHEIDAAILATQHPELDFSVIPLYKEPFWLAYPPNHAFYNQEEITQQDLDNTQLLLLSEGHCLAQQAMQACHLSERPEQGGMANLRASSLETLLQLVAVGYGTTLIPALSLTGSWISGRGVVTRELSLPNTWRQVSLYYRPSYPRIAALEALQQIIKANLPNTVEKL
ncbi:MAG: LysR family transcriptional regulator [Gammaproteobacteria bacterium]|nr:LysR family transcriptional regulator [Gammaproteobacteria bacterium]MBL6998501.1 LysR family transcriptional regulator [Gammaproteobacteria bacterium]